MRGKKAARAAPMLALAAFEQVFGLQDIGAVQEHLGGHPGGDVRQGCDGAQRLGQQVGRHRRPDQKVQGIFVLCHLRGVAGDVHPGRIHPGLRLAQIQFGAKPDVERAGGSGCRRPAGSPGWIGPA